MAMKWLNEPYDNPEHNKVDFNIYWDDVGRYIAQFTSTAPNKLLEAVKVWKGLAALHSNGRVFIKATRIGGSYPVGDTESMPKKSPTIHSKQFCENVIKAITGNRPASGKSTYRFKIISDNHLPKDFYELKFQMIIK